MHKFLVGKRKEKPASKFDYEMVSPTGGGTYEIKEPQEETKEPRKGDISPSPFASTPRGYSVPAVKPLTPTSKTPALKTPALKLASKTLTTKLKALYSAQSELPKLIEDESIPEQGVDGLHINLQILTEDKRGARSKHQIDISQIFDEVEGQGAPAKVLIIGEAGIGKTTLLHSISYGWSKGTIFADKFDCVFKVDLKKLLFPRIKAALERVTTEYILPKLIEMSIEDQQMKLIHKHKSSGVEVSTAEIPPALQGRVLLLVDGYNEITLSKQDDTDDVVCEVMRIIDKYPFIITSRPNMIPPDKQGVFTRKIEITGFNQAESENYISQYFTKQQEALSQDIDDFYKVDKAPTDKVIQRMQAHFSEQGSKFTVIKGIITGRSTISGKPVIILEQGPIKLSIITHYQSIEQALKTLLSGNFCLKELAAIPINLMMLCLIASDQGSMPQFHGDFNIGTLYQELLIWLGRRSSQIKDQGTCGSILDLEGFATLRSIAYAGFSQGGVIGDAVIDKFSKQHIQPWSIKGVCEFGLLRKEIVVVQNKEEANDAYAFTHPCFQEYLAAWELAARLIHRETQTVTDAAEFIAWHRSEPRCLNTLKFLSGIVSNHQHNSQTLLVTRFWEAVTCNVDGILELGIETKVTLLMHLLNQAKIKGVIDPRIPNLQIIQNLIDKTVLKDFTKWGQQIIDSGYLSERIVEKLMSMAGGGSTDTEEHKGPPKEEEGCHTIDKLQGAKVAIEIITSLLNKREFGGREKILKQLLSLLRSHDREIQKLGLENLSKIIDSTVETSSLQECASIVTNLFLSANTLAHQAARVLAKIIKILPSRANKSLDSLSVILNNDAADDSLKEAASKGLLEILKAMPPAEAHTAIKTILTDTEAGNHHKTVAISSLIEISKAFPASASIAIGTINSILISEESSHILKKAVVKALSKIAKVVPEYVHVAVEVMQIVLNNDEATTALKITATESLTEIAQAVPSHAVTAFEVMQIILNKEMPTDLKIAATKSISEIVKILPAYTTNALRIMMVILNNEKADDSLKDVAAKNFPEILHVTQPVEVWSIVQETLNSKQASDNLKIIVINCIYGIFKPMLPCDISSCAPAAFEAIMKIICNKKATDNLRKVAISNLGELVEIMPDRSLAAFDAMKKLWKSKKASAGLKEAAAFSLAQITGSAPTCSSAAFDVIKAILDSNEASDYIKAEAAQSLPKIVKTMLGAEALAKISSILNSKQTNDHLKAAAIKSLPEIVKTMHDTVAFGVLKSALGRGDLSEEHKKAAVHSLVEIVKVAPDYSFKVVEVMIDILNKEVTDSLKIAASQSLREIIKATSSCPYGIFDPMRVILVSEEASEELKKIIVLNFSEMVRCLSSSAVVVLDIMKTTLNSGKATIGLKIAAAKSLGAITHASPDCAEEAFNLMKAILIDEGANPSLKLTAIDVIAEIACSSLPWVPFAFKEMQSILDREEEEMAYLKGEAIKSMYKIAKAMPVTEAFAAIKYILNSEKASGPFKKEVENGVKEIIKLMSFDEVSNLLNDKIGVIRNLAKLEILERLKNDEEVEKLSHEQAATIFSIIAKTKSNGEERELNLSAKEALGYMLATIDETGIDWLNKHFGELSDSPEARSFLGAIFHKILSDDNVSKIEADFIIKCIVIRGFPLIIITSGVKIIFENVVYCLQKGNQKILEIVETISPLTLQYKTDEVFFPNTGSALPIAVTDTPLEDDGETGNYAESQLSGESLECY